MLAAAALALLPIVALLVRGVPIGGANSGHDADFAIHMQRLYTQELLAGHFPVRWLADGNDSFGSPAFYFYPQLGFLVGTAWQVLFGLTAERALAVTVALARLAAFIGAYAWLKLRVPDRPRLAALGAALFLLSPHIVSGLIYQRFFFGESVAVTWLPLALLSVDAPWRLGTRTLFGAAVFALLAFTHVPETVLVGVLAVGYALACHGPRRAAEIVGAGVLGGLMAAIGLVPAFMLRGWINVAGWNEW